MALNFDFEKKKIYKMRAVLYNNKKRNLNLNLRGVHVLGRNTRLPFLDVGLRPPASRGQPLSGKTPGEDRHAHFLMRIDSIWMKPVVSVGSNPPSSSIEDSFSSYSP